MGRHHLKWSDGPRFPLPLVPFSKRNAMIFSCIILNWSLEIKQKRLMMSLPLRIYDFEERCLNYLFPSIINVLSDKIHYDVKNLIALFLNFPVPNAILFLLII